MTRIWFASITLGLFALASMGMSAGQALVDGRPTVRANAYGTALSWPSAIEPASQSRRFALQSTFAGENQ